MKAININIKSIFPLFLIVFILSAHLAEAQILAKPAKWSCELPQKYEMGDTISITFTADLDEGWLMYSSDYDSTGVISPAKFSFKANGTLGFLDEIKAIGSQQYRDTLLNETVTVMREKAIYVQRAIVFYNPAHLEGSVEYVMEKRSAASTTVWPLVESFDERF